jgi:hypothetical protein
MENEEIQILDAGIYEQQDRAMIDTQIATAKKYPRNITRSTSNAIAIVTMDMETAKVCTYSVPRGGKSITGPSVHLAKILLQQWGNLRVEAKVVETGDRQLTSEAVCFDLETNIAVKVQVKRSIMTKNGRMNDDMITVTGNAANSIALRNAVYNVIPRGVVDKVYDSAKKMITGDLSSETKLIAKRKQVVDALKDTYNITEEEVLKSVGKAAQSQLTTDDIITLIGIGTAIKDGDTTVDFAFRNIKANTAESTPIKSNEEIAAERIKIMLEDCKTIKEVEELAKNNPEINRELVVARKDELKQAKLL